MKENSVIIITVKYIWRKQHTQRITHLPVNICSLSPSIEGFLTPSGFLRNSCSKFLIFKASSMQLSYRSENINQWTMSKLMIMFIQISLLSYLVHIYCLQAFSTCENNSMVLVFWFSFTQDGWSWKFYSINDLQLDSKTIQLKYCNIRN